MLGGGDSREILAIRKKKNVFNTYELEACERTEQPFQLVQSQKDDSTHSPVWAHIKSDKKRTAKQWEMLQMNGQQHFQKHQMQIPAREQVNLKQVNFRQYKQGPENNCSSSCLCHLPASKISPKHVHALKANENALATSNYYLLHY